jgi:uncharacterized protein YqhQ
MTRISLLSSKSCICVGIKRQNIWYSLFPCGNRSIHLQVNHNATFLPTHIHDLLLSKLILVINIAEICFLLRCPIISSFLSTAQSFNVLTEKNNIDNWLNCRLLLKFIYISVITSLINNSFNYYKGSAAWIVSYTVDS